MNNNFEIQITVNGNKCKQYNFNNKTFIESKQGSEYTIEIKNNYYKRILAVSAVDGLNVLTGETADEMDSGYIIDSYHSEKIKGFRISDDEWAMFKFGYKFNGNIYAQSKEDGSEKNCGVIGLRLFYEYDPVVNWVPQTYSLSSSYCPSPGVPTWLTDNSSTPINTNFYNQTISDSLSGGTFKNCSQELNMTYGSSNCSNWNKIVNAAPNNIDFSCLRNSSEPKGFDMGTEFGRAEKSKVKTVEFQRGLLAHSLDIYYASRESLIEMGVPLTNDLKINLPKSFPNSYCEPPKNWKR